MNKLHGYRKLGKTSDHRRAFLRNLATSMVDHGRIKTTVPRAKDLRRIVEDLVTLGCKGGLHRQRKIRSVLFTRSAAQKTWTELAKRFNQRPGGYTRIQRLGTRFGDGADMCFLEFVDYTDHEGKAKEAAKKKKSIKSDESKTQ